MGKTKSMFFFQKKKTIFFFSPFFVLFFCYIHQTSVLFSVTLNELNIYVNPNSINIFIIKINFNYITKIV